MNIELGKIYACRNGEYEVRIISLIGTWSKKHPVVGELYLYHGKRKIPLEGLFQRYEHWDKNGNYLQKGSESEFDLVAEVEMKDGKRAEIKPGTQGSFGF